MQRKTIAKLGFMIALLVLTLHFGAPPAGADTCQHECFRDFIGCQHACGLFCIGDDACLADCNAGCAADYDTCLSFC